jgi:hypothetical protein
MGRGESVVILLSVLVEAFSDREMRAADVEA